MYTYKKHKNENMMRRTSECHEANICIILQQKCRNLLCLDISCTSDFEYLKDKNVNSTIRGKTKMSKERADHAFKLQISVLTQNFEQTVEQCRAFSSYASKQGKLLLIISGVQHLHYETY